MGSHITEVKNKVRGKKQNTESQLKGIQTDRQTDRDSDSFKMDKGELSKSFAEVLNG
jgi:hypothetical protein